MKKSGRCPKCGSTDLIADAKAVDRGHGNHESDMIVATFGKPEKWIFKDEHTTKLSAWVCLGCGYLEFWADTPANLVIAGRD
jgi:predicted nucleic-acid-binding Zn-ribbon protein